MPDKSGVPRSASTTIVPNGPWPAAKFFVPSSGSTIQTGAACFSRSSTAGSAATASSPTTVEFGTNSRNLAVSAASAARSADVTKSSGSSTVALLITSLSSSFWKRVTISACATSRSTRPTCSNSALCMVPAGLSISSNERKPNEPTSPPLCQTCYFEAESSESSRLAEAQVVEVVSARVRVDVELDLEGNVSQAVTEVLLQGSGERKGEARELTRGESVEVHLAEVLVVDARGRGGHEHAYRTIVVGIGLVRG